MRLSINDAIVIHGGGWKNLKEHSIDNLTFISSLKSLIKVRRCVNYYGMVEQTGSLFEEVKPDISMHQHMPILLYENQTILECLQSVKKG